jgi:hypothetical protein
MSHGPFGAMSIGNDGGGSPTDGGQQVAVIDPAD